MAKTPKAPKLVDPEGEAIIKHLDGLTVRGKPAMDLIGDAKGARTLHSLMRRYGAKYKGCEEFEETLMDAVKDGVANSITDKDKIAFLRLGMQATEANAKVTTELLTIMGLSKAPDNSTTVSNVNIAQVNIEKALNITDNRTGAHARTPQVQEYLLGLSEALFDTGTGASSRVSLPVGPTVGVRTGKDDDPAAPQIALPSPDADSDGKGS